MTPELFTQIVDIGLIVIFVLIIVFFLLAALIGYKRGVWKMTFKFVLMTLFIVLSIFALDPIASLVSKLPVDIFGYKSLTITNTTTNISYNVNLTTFGETLYESLKGFYSIFNMHVTLDQAAQFATAFSGAIVRFTAFFLCMVLILSLGNFLIFLLWHLCFKHIIPKFARRKVKGRLIGLLENAILYVVCTFMLLSPVTSIINATSKAYKSTNQGTSDKYVQYVDNFMDSYDNSLFAQVFFNWTTNDDDLTIDTAFIDAITSSSFEDGSISLVSAISELVELTSYFSNSVTTNGQGVTIDLSIILDEEIISQFFDSLKESTLITYLLPVAVEVALNIADIEAFVDPSLLEISDIDWVQEVENVENLYLNLLESGLVEELTSNGVSSPNALIKSLLSEEKYPYVLNAIHSIDNSKLLTRSIVAVMNANIQNNSDVKKYFSMTAEELCDIRWGFELGVVYDTLYEINKVSDELIDAILPAPEAKPLAATGSEEDSDMTNIIIEVLLENLDEFQEILIGETNNNDEITGVDSNGRTIVYENGEKLPGKRYNLFDLQISKFLLSSLSEPLKDLFEDPNAAVKVEETLDKLSSGNWRMNFKQEFVYVFQALAPFAGDYDVLLPVLNGEFPEDITQMDDKLIQCLTKSLPRIDRSDILSSVLYDVVTDAIESSKDTFTSFGLDFDLIQAAMNECKTNRTLGKELAPIMASIKDIGDISNILSSTSDTGELINKLSETNNNIKVARLLDTIYNSKILNYHTSTSNIDLNYFNLMNYIFSSINVNGITFFDGDYNQFRKETAGVKWANTVDSNGNYLIDSNGNPIYDGENGMFCNVIRSFGKSGILSAIMDDPNFFSDNSNFLKLAYSVEEGGYDLPGVLSTINESKTFSYTMGTYLDSQLEMVVDASVDVTFTNVTDWHQEGQNLKKILIAVGTAPDINLNNLDFSSIKDVVGLNNILHALACSTIFIDKTDSNPETNFRFGEWLYAKVQSSMSSLTDSSFNSDQSKEPYNLVRDPDVWQDSWGNKNSPTQDGSNTYHILYNDFVYKSTNTRKTLKDWIGDEDGFYSLPEFSTSDLSVGYAHYYDNPNFLNEYSEYLMCDEIARLVNVVYWAAQAISSDDLLKMDETIFSGLLNAINQTQCLRIVVYNLYELAKQVFDSTGTNDFFDLSPAYSTYLIDCGGDMWNFDDSSLYGGGTSLGDRNLRKQEIDILVNLYSLYQHMDQTGIMSGSNFDANKIDSIFTEKARKALLDLNASNVFHRCGPYTGETTVFQNSVKSFLTKFEDVKNMFYSDSNPKDQYFKLTGTYTTPDEKAEYLIKENFAYNVSDFSLQEKEILQVFEVMNSIVGGTKKDSNEKYHGLTNSADKVTFDFNNINWKNSDNVEAAVTTLKLMNDSILLCDAVPTAIQMAFETNGTIITDAIPSSMTCYINLGEANVYYNYFTPNGSTYKVDWNAKMQNEDFETLEFLLEQVSLKENDSPECLIPTSFDNISVFKEVGGVSKADDLNEFLMNIAGSEMFHRSGTKLQIVDTDLSIGIVSSDTNDLTVFQEIIMQFTATSDLKDIIINPNNIKDQTLYGSDLDTKLNTLIHTVFDSKADKNAISNEIDNVTEFLKAAAQLDSLDFAGMDVDTLNANDCAYVLETLNNSKLLYDCVPNIVYKIFHEGKFDALGGSTAVQFNKATPYFVYTYLDTPGTYTFTRHYPMEEIDNLKNIIVAYKDLVTTIGTDSYGNPRSLNDISAISDLLDTGDLYDVLKCAYNSYCLHTYNEYHGNVVVTTVFEDIVRYFVEASGVSKFIFDDYNHGFATEDEYVIHRITEITSYENAHSINTTGYHETWFTDGTFIGEIESLIDFIKLSRDQLISEDTYDFSKVQFEKMSPEVCREIMYAMNDCDLVAEALPVFIKDGLKNPNIGISELATYGGVDEIHYYLTQYEFGGDHYHKRNPGCEIDLLYGALENMALYDSNGDFVTYTTIAEIEQFVEKVDNLDGVFNLLSKGELFKQDAFEVLPGKNATARGLVLYNILKDVSYDSTNGLYLDNLVTGNNANEKIYVLSSIFNINKFDPIVESRGLFSLVKEQKSSIKSINGSLTNVSALGGMSDTVVSLLKTAYNADGNNHRSYFVSELVSNLLNEVVVKEEVKISVPYVSVRYGLVDIETINDDAYSNSNRLLSSVCYSAINEEEVTAIEGVLILESITQDLLDIFYGSGEKLDAAAIKDAFAKMGNRNISKIIYLAEIDSIVNLVSPTVRDAHYPNINEVNFNFAQYGIDLANDLVSKGFAQ